MLRSSIDVKGKTVFIIIDATSPIFQNEIIQLIQFQFIIGMSNIQDFNKEQIALKLLYQGGIKELTLNLEESVIDKIDITKLVLH